jgi:hypothetical protein
MGPAIHRHEKPRPGMGLSGASERGSKIPRGGLEGMGNQPEGAATLRPSWMGYTMPFNPP